MDDACVLVAVNDSEPAFRAAAVAVDYAVLMGARLRVLSVVEPFDDVRHRFATTAADHRAQQERAAAAAQHHVATLAARAGVAASATVRHGTVGAQVLAESEECGADLVVMARVSRPGHVVPTVGSQTMRVLEFTEVPVLVVPTPVRGVSA